MKEAEWGTYRGQAHTTTVVLRQSGIDFHSFGNEGGPGGGSQGERRREEVR